MGQTVLEIYCRYVISVLYNERGHHISHSDLIMVDNVTISTDAPIHKILQSVRNSNGD